MEKQRNPVAKNARKFNKATVQRDKKKDQKRGYKVKHKNKLYASTTPPVDEDITSSDMNGLQKDAGKLKKHGIDLDLGTRHFKDRANDDRNEPTITKQDIQSLIKKIDNGKGVKIKQRGDGEAVLRDKKTRINVPVAVRKDRDGSGKKISTATAKTIMRKKDFKSSSPTIAYEANEGLKVSDGMPTWIKDFQKSDAPQFQGKSDKKRKQMAIAAYMDAKGGTMKEVKEPTGDLKDACWKGYTAVGTKKKNGKTVPNCVPKEDSGKVSGIDGSKRVGTKIVPKYIPKKDAVITISADNSDVNELSNATLSRYKTKAAKQASAADKAGNYKKADKRFSGITRATNKQFKNDAKKRESVEEAYTKYSWNDVNKAMTKANYMKGNPAHISRVASKFDHKSGKDKNFTHKDIKKNLSAAGISPSQHHNIMKNLGEALSPIEKRKHMNLKRRAKAGDRSAVTQLRQFEKDHTKDLEKKPRSAKQISKGDGSGQDSNLIVQLRKSQDSGGKHAVEVGGGKTVKLDKKTVDKLLKQYDGMKPDSKRKWQVVATKKLRSMAK